MLSRSLFLGQHQGGGIAEHIFFRGFDADHGTDVNVSVDGTRLDNMHFNYADKLAAPLPSRAKFVMSPILNIEYTANSTVQLYLKTGKGFHSNDAKVVVANTGLQILSAAYGADRGIKSFPG